MLSGNLGEPGGYHVRSKQPGCHDGPPSIKSRSEGVDAEGGAPEPPSLRSCEPAYGARGEELRDLLKPDARAYARPSSSPCPSRSRARSSEDKVNQLTPTKTRHVLPAVAPRRVPLPARPLSMEEERDGDVSFSRAEEDEEQSPATTEKLAVSLPMHLPCVDSCRVADRLLRK